MCVPRLVRSAVFSFAAAACAAVAAPPEINSIGLKLVPVPAGDFMMGSTPKPANWDEQPVHKVTISAPFLISDTEVTAGQFKQFKPSAALNPAYAPYAAGVSWEDATAFCAWLSKKEGKNYRLPTEAEWEFAARAGRADGSPWETAADAANPWGCAVFIPGPSSGAPTGMASMASRRSAIPWAMPRVAPRSCAAATWTTRRNSSRLTTCGPRTGPPRRRISAPTPARRPIRRITGCTGSVFAWCWRRR